MWPSGPWSSWLLSLEGPGQREGFLNAGVVEITSPAQAGLLHMAYFVQSYNLLMSF